MDMFQIGSVLGTSIRALARNFVAFFMIAALVFTPVLLCMLYWIDGMNRAGSFAESSGQIQNFTLVITMLSVLAGSLVTAALTYGVVMDVQGQRISTGSCLSNGLLRALPALGVVIASSIAIMGGMMLLIVPGVIVACMLYVAVPASVMERPGIFGALRRSRELTAGHRLEVFGILLLLGVTRIIVLKVSSSSSALSSLEDVKHFAYVQIGIDAVFAAVGAVIASTAYCALRREKEGSFTTRLGTAFE